MNRYGDLETMMMKVMTDKKYRAEIARKFLPNNQKQSNKNDYHMWCVDKHGNIKDVYAIHHPDIKLTYKEWKTTPSYYKDMIERKLKAFNTWTKEDKIKYFKDTSSVDFNCSTNSCFQKVLFGWDIKVGSVGIAKDDGSIFWEFGNGKDYSDFE